MLSLSLSVHVMRGKVIKNCIPKQESNFDNEEDITIKNSGWGIFHEVFSFIEKYKICSFILPRQIHFV